MGRPCRYDYVGPGSWAQDLGLFSCSGDEAIAAVKETMAHSTIRIDPDPRPVCRMFDRCEGCPYPAHGFICWGPDKGCLRSEMQKICPIKEAMKQ